MAERALRGTRLGATSYENDRNTDLAPRQEVAFDCPKGHRFTVPFSAEAELPTNWECRVCGASGGDCFRRPASCQEDQAAAQPLGHAHGAAHHGRPRGSAGRAAGRHPWTARAGRGACAAAEQQAPQERLTSGCMRGITGNAVLSRKCRVTPHWVTLSSASATMALLILLLPRARSVKVIGHLGDHLRGLSRPRGELDLEAVALRPDVVQAEIAQRLRPVCPVTAGGVVH